MLTIFCSMEKGVTCLKNNLTNFEHKNNNLRMQIAGLINMRGNDFVEKKKNCTRTLQHKKNIIVYTYIVFQPMPNGTDIYDI